ncbi:ABC transporter permease [bacterium]|nr:ABC transporter permease [bacterium]
MIGILRKKIRRDLFQRKGALITLIAISTIGVAVFIGMTSVWRDLDGARARYYSKYRLTDFVVDMKRAPASSVKALESLPNVREVYGRVAVAARLDLPSVQEPLSGTAISIPEEPRPVLNDLMLKRGTWFSSREAEEVILNDAFASANNLRPGDRLKVLLLDKQHDLLIVGTAMSPEFVYLLPPSGGIAPDPARFGVLYLSEPLLRRAADMEGAYNQVLGKVHDTRDVALDNTLDNISRHLDSFGVLNTIRAIDQPSVRFLADELRGLKVSATIMPSIFLGVAALILNVMLGRMVVQQRSIIGTLRAIGYSRSSVSLHYMAYGLTIGALGGLLGAAGGVLIQAGMLGIYRGFYNLPDMRLHVYSVNICAGVLISIVFAILGTIRGVRYAARLSPAEAMRPAPPERVRPILIERIGPLWRRLPFQTKMMLRDLFRNPFRSLVGILASIIATALILSTLSMVDALDLIVTREFVQVMHQDVTAGLRDPVGREVLEEAQTLPGVVQSEPELGIVCDLSNGPLDKRTSITGILPGARLHTPLDAHDNPVPIPESGLVLTKKLAEILDLKAGDRVRLRPLIGTRQETTAPVVQIVDSYLGLGAYADMRYLSRLIGEEWVSNSLLLKTEHGDGRDGLVRELRRRPAVVGMSSRLRALHQIDATFAASMGAILSILVLFSGAIAFGSVFNAALVALSERHRDIGTFRVLGYMPNQIARIFAGESLALNGVGIALGLLAGVGLAHLMSMAYNTELYRFPTVILPIRFFEGAGLMILFVSLAQLIIFRLVRRLNWLEVLKVKE